MRPTSIAQAALVLGLLSLTGCVSAPQGFEWGRYEPALYTYAKKPDQRPAYESALEDAIERGRKTNRVAPGLLAELGYLHLEDGDVRGAVSLFEEEAQRFPEAAPFMRTVIARAKGDQVKKVSSK